MVKRLKTRAGLGRDAVISVLREFWDIPDWEVDRYTYHSMISLPATYDRPAITCDCHDGELWIVFPDEQEEIPNPDSPAFYPDFWEEVKNPEDLKEYLDEETVKKIVGECRVLSKNEEYAHYCGEDPFRCCIIEHAYEEFRKRLEKEMEEEIGKIENSEPEYKSFCGVLVVKQADIYEEPRVSEFNEYTAFIPSTAYVIDLKRVESPEKLKCVIEKIIEEG